MICLETVKRFCKEYRKIENYSQAMADTTQTWHCHHRHEIDWALPKEELITVGRYYDVHYSELIFLTPEEHKRLHRQGKRHTKESKAKMSAAKKGNTWNKGRQFTEEWKHRLSESGKGNQNPLKYHISAEELYNLYVIQGLSTPKIAKIYGCYPQTIHYKLKKFNIRKNE